MRFSAAIPTCTDVNPDTNLLPCTLGEGIETNSRCENGTKGTICKCKAGFEPPPGARSELICFGKF